MTLLLSTALEIHLSLIVASQLTSLRIAPSCMLPSLSDDDMQTCISSLQDAVDVELASRLYHKLSHLSAPRFAAHRLHLPCVVFLVTEVRWRRGDDQQLHSTFAVSFREQDPLGKFSSSSIHEIVPFLR